MRGLKKKNLHAKFHCMHYISRSDQCTNVHRLKVLVCSRNCLHCSIRGEPVVSSRASFGKHQRRCLRQGTPRIRRVSPHNRNQTLRENPALHSFSLRALARMLAQAWCSTDGVATTGSRVTYIGVQPPALMLVRSSCAQRQAQTFRRESDVFAPQRWRCVHAGAVVMCSTKGAAQPTQGQLKHYRSRLCIHHWHKRTVLDDTRSIHWRRNT